MHAESHMFAAAAAAAPSTSIDGSNNNSGDDNEVEDVWRVHFIFCFTRESVAFALYQINDGNI